MPDNKSNGDSGSSFSLWEVFDDAIDDSGFRVEGYDILGELNRGGMGVVYHALQLNPEREVALKVLLPKYASDSSMLERFQLEAKAMAGLDHPSLLPIYEVGKADNMPFFSMKLASGGSLEEILEKEQPSIEQSIDWLIQLSEAVHHAHLNGVIHRDLKPANFLFDDQNQIHVTDFGVAKILAEQEHQLTLTQAIIGTPYYLPPEIASGEVSKGNASGDLYSLGAVLYECLTGQRTHSDKENLASLLRSISDDAIPLARSIKPSIPLDLETICAKALERSPENRYQSVAAFYDDLLRWKKGEPILARSVGLLERAWKWVKRYPLVASLLGLFTLTAVTGSILLAISNHQKDLANKETQEKLYELRLKDAQSERLIAAPGYRSRVLELLELASKHRKSSQIRNEAIAVLSKVDITKSAEATDDFVNKGFPKYTVDEKDTINSLVYSSNNKWLFVLYESGIGKLWNIEQKSLFKTWEPLPGLSISFDFLNDSSGFIITGVDKDIIQQYGSEFNLNEPLSNVDYARFVTTSPTKAHVALGGVDGLQIFNYETQKIVWENHIGPARCAPAYSEDGNYVAAVLGEQKHIRIFDAITGKECFSYNAISWPESLSFSQDSHFLAALCNDKILAIYDLMNNNLLAELPANNSTFQFSESSKSIRFESREGETEYWDILTSAFYREWIGQELSEGNTKVFDAKLSPDEKWLLTITTKGIELWDVMNGAQTDFHITENQRIDANTDAWWLNNNEILIQVPGGLEKIFVNSEGGLSTPKKQLKSPGTSILEIDANGDWYLEALNEDDEISFVRWPNGSEKIAEVITEKAIRSLTKDLLTISNKDGFQASVLSDNSIQLAGKYTHLLTPPKSEFIKKVLYASTSNHLIVFTADYRLFDWNLSHLEAELETLGF